MVEKASAVMNKLKLIVAEMDASARSEFVQKFKKPPVETPSKPPTPPKRDSSLARSVSTPSEEVKPEPPAPATQQASPPETSSEVIDKVEPVSVLQEPFVDDGGEAPMDLETSAEASPVDVQASKDSDEPSPVASKAPALQVMDEEELLKKARHEEKMDVSQDVLVPKPKHDTVTPWFLRPAHEVEAERKRIAEEEELARQKEREAEEALQREEAEDELNGVDDNDEEEGQGDVTPMDAMEDEEELASESAQLDEALDAANDKKAVVQTVQSHASKADVETPVEPAKPVATGTTTTSASADDMDADVWDMLENIG